VKKTKLGVLALEMGASVSAPSEGEGSTLGGETDNDDLGGGDDDFDYEASLRRCSLCVRVSGLLCGRVRVRVSC